MRLRRPSVVGSRGGPSRTLVVLASLEGGLHALLAAVRACLRVLPMPIATSYPLLEIFWTMLIFFGFVVWLWILFTVIADIFRRHDTSGFMKVLWLIFIIVIPYFGVFIYLIIEHKGMTERAVSAQKAAQAEVDQYVQSVASKGDPAQQIASAKELLDNGT